MELDLAIEGLWYIFSFSVASCYPTIGEDRSTWFVNFFHDFDLEFLQPMYNQW